MNKRILLPLLSVSVLAFAACGGDDAATDADSIPAPIDVEQPWARATVSAQPHAAVYMELTADHDDVLVGASVSTDVADHAEIHEVVAADESGEDMDDMDMGDESGGDHEGMAPGMIMREVADGISLAPDATVVFEPGGYHVMLLDLVEPLEVGAEFELTLEFAQNDDVTIIVPVEETAP